jgi:hypothetical protein
MKKLIGKGLKLLFNPANQRLSDSFWNDRKPSIWARVWCRFYTVVIPEKAKAWW